MLFRLTWEARYPLQSLMECIRGIKTSYSRFSFIWNRVNGRVPTKEMWKVLEKRKFVLPVLKCSLIIVSVLYWCLCIYKRCQKLSFWWLCWWWLRRIFTSHQDQRFLDAMWGFENSKREESFRSVCETENAAND